MTKRELSALYPTDLPAWQALTDHYADDMQKKSLADLFELNERRFDGYSLKVGDLFLDYSKNFLNSKTKKLLTRLAHETAVPNAIDAMFRGDKINHTERRSVLHAALRAKPEDGVALDVDGVKEVPDVLSKIEQFVNALQNGDIRGHTGRRLTEIVNIGIGGSDLGPVMASKALRHFWTPGMNFYSVSNVDGTQLVDLTEQLDPEETLFVICSKTFSTQETLVNANAASEWIGATLGSDAVNSHFAAASTNHDAMDAFGINGEYRFGFWDWVGGRYSIWSAVGLSLALVIGMENFRALLAGARDMDRHFQTAELDENMPVVMAMIAIWYNNFYGAESQAILPYDNRLERFPAYIQQVEMESNGKRVRTDGKPVTVDTSMLVWGEPGSNAQHSFYQLLHQGTRFVPIDFLLSSRPSGGDAQEHALAIANCLAQSEALMDGYNGDGLPHKAHPGNRPSNTLLMSALTPNTLGQLVALYEHRVFVQGVVWGINSFDQYGVELGKRLSRGLEPAVRGDETYSGGNGSTQGLLETLRSM